MNEMKIYNVGGDTKGQADKYDDVNDLIKLACDTLSFRFRGRMKDLFDKCPKKVVKGLLKNEYGMDVCFDVGKATIYDTRPPFVETYYEVSNFWLNDTRQEIKVKKVKL